MGNRRDNRPGFAARVRTHAASRRQGKANSDLIIALCLVGLVALLMQVQSGAIDIGGMLAKKDKPGAGAGGATGSGIIVLPEAASDPFAQAGTAFVAQRSAEVKKRELEAWRLRSAMAWADADAAARSLEQLNPPIAAALLEGMPMRGLSRILSAADPTISSKWLDLMANPAALPAVPDELKKQAAAAGLYDDSTDLLDAARLAATPATDASGAAGTTPAGGPGA